MPAHDDKPKPTPVTRLEDDDALSRYKDDPAALIAFFDAAAALGAINGVVVIELSVACLTPNQDRSAAINFKTAARLRGSVTAAKNLRDALNRAIEMAESGGQDAAPVGQLN